MTKGEEDTDMIIARMGKGQKIASGSVIVTGNYSTDTSCSNIISILNAYVHGRNRCAGDIHAFPSDTAGYLMLRVFTTDYVGLIAESTVATDIHWSVLGTK